MKRSGPHLSYIVASTSWHSNSQLPHTVIGYGTRFIHSMGIIAEIISPIEVDLHKTHTPKHVCT